MFRIIIIMLDQCLLCGTMIPMGEPLRTQLIEWQKARENDMFDFSKEIHEYCKADVQLLSLVA